MDECQHGRFVRGPVYPDGPWRPKSGVQRGSVQFLSICPGEPTSGTIKSNSERELQLTATFLTSSSCSLALSAVLLIAILYRAYEQVSQREQPGEQHHAHHSSHASLLG